MSREERSASRKGLSRSTANSELLLPRHTSGRVGATSKLASVAREYRALYSGTTTANGFESTPILGLSVRISGIESARRSWPSVGVGGNSHCTYTEGKDGKRKLGRVHAGGSGGHCRCGKAPFSRSDRPPQGGRKRVERGGLQEFRRESPRLKS